MKRTAVTAALLSLLTATSAFAEHKLLVTEVPEPGQVEARVDVAYSNLDGKLGAGSIGDEKTAAVATVGAGVAEGLKVSISLPYTFAQHLSEGATVNRDGFGDITLGARYVLTKGLVALPLDAVVGIDWKTTTASNGEENTGTGRNVYAPYLAVSKNLHTVIPYAKYQPEYIANDRDSVINHNLTLGAEIELSHMLSLDVSAKCTANEKTSEVKSANDVEFEVAPYINVASNLYVLPRVAYKVLGDRSIIGAGETVKRIDEYTLGLGVYYLF